MSVAIAAVKKVTCGSLMERFSLISASSSVRSSPTLAPEAVPTRPRTPGVQPASSYHATQTDAILRARDIVRLARGGETVIHGRDGRFRESDTVTAADAAPAA